MQPFNPEELRTRNHEMFDLSEKSVIIVGCGTIGSFTATALIRSGLGNIHLVDPDIVEAHNIGVQDYFVKDIGYHKVTCLYERLSFINPTAYVSTYSKTFQDIAHSFIDNDFLILAVDSMAQRKEILTCYCAQIEKNNNLVIIDARMGSEVFQMYTFPGGDYANTISAFNNTYYSDEEGDDEPCSARSTAYCGYIAGAFITSEIKKWTTEGCITTNKMIFSFPTLTLKPTINIPKLEDNYEQYKNA